MGIYKVTCLNEDCKQPFMWFSGNLAQVCEKCGTGAVAGPKTKKKEDASTNALGALPMGRLVNKKKKSVKELINPLKVEGETMSLAKKYLSVLFEEEPEMEIDGDDAPPPDAPVDGDVEVEVEPDMDKDDSELKAACAELADIVDSVEDEDLKGKLQSVADKFKAMCSADSEEPEMEEPSMEEPADSEEPEMEEPQESKVYPWTK